MEKELFKELQEDMRKLITKTRNSVRELKDREHHFNKKVGREVEVINLMLDIIKEKYEV